MTVLDPSRLNLHLPDFDPAAAAETARTSLDRVTELAREAIAGLELERHRDEAGDKVRNVVHTTAVRAAIARLERELPENERNRYNRAYLRGRTQARSVWLTVGIAAGVGLGVAAAVLLDPRNGKARRDALKARARTLADRSTHTIRDAIRRDATPPVESAADEPEVVEIVAAEVEETLPISAG